MSRARSRIGAVRSSFAPWNDPTAKPLVRFEGVTKRFGAETAVNKVWLAIYEREFFALLGPSGCGKTTLMRMLAGFEAPDEGKVVLAGQDLAGIPPHKRPVNMMFQSYALFPHLSVEQNIAFGLQRRGLEKAAILARVAEMLELVRLTPYAKRRPHQLSGGQRQRVALARAIAPKPKMLLLDEPLAALDKKLRAETQFELMELQQKVGLTFLIVTHDQEEAMVVADRIAVMRAGEIVQMGRPSEVYEAPNSRYVADFIGDVNLFEAKAVSVLGDMVRFGSAEAASELVVLDDEDHPAPGDTAWIAVRPEKLVIHQSEPKRQPNLFAGKVADIGYLGDWTTYLVALEGGRTLRCARANSERLVENPIDWDDPVWVTFAPDAGVVLTQ